MDLESLGLTYEKATVRNGVFEKVQRRIISQGSDLTLSIRPILIQCRCKNIPPY